MQTDETKLRELCENFALWQKRVNERKKRGENDFNPLLCVQKQNDEVNMHSGFLYALLHPRGEHCQDELFLELFLESLSLKSFFSDIKNANVSKERKNIDIHITNGQKHIIIENKIGSGDQEGQIARYIDTIAQKLCDDEADSESVDLQSKIYDNIAVVYLTPHNWQPNVCSLSHNGIKWEIQGDFLESSKGKVAYRQISYETHILQWLDKCMREISNIANLKMAIECYKDVVERVVRKKENTMSMAAFFMDNENLHTTALELCKNQDSVMEATFGLIDRAIKEKYREKYTTKYGADYFCAWVSELDKCELSFTFAAEINTKGKKRIREFCIYLFKHDTNKTTELLPVLQEITGLKENDFDPNTTSNNNLCVGLKSYHYTDDIFFNPQEFLDFFEENREFVDKINAKIKADLDKGADSKLAKFSA
ncbi:PD-(D/E)XK nuclease family protein [Helicobacter sp. MIT 21-1697]|uniref:PDDEXK-like family protein n=1 Tax=Helicobacter sp. MIT 21-1697 TaxID=2993733 RepID=UPI00224AA54B|nr:PD-(D/E)XK nuclease family protein [Helicobacter sp. MIT 21-1697]MCX2716951.1 PD-(D/E)XK nuclease family protein [Helicobacter sp. MIT 21-1697]